jgi:hypothetical protein
VNRIRPLRHALALALAVPAAAALAAEPSVKAVEDNAGTQVAAAQGTQGAVQVAQAQPARC